MEQRSRNIVARRTARLVPLILAGGIGLSVSGCSTFEPIVETHGYMPAKADVERLRPGVHNISSVQRLLGSPSAITRFQHRSWLYISQRSETVAFLAPKMVRRQVLELQFNQKGILQDVKRYDLKDGKRIEIAEDKTKTRGSELTILQQLLGNLGRFSTAEEDQ